MIVARDLEVFGTARKGEFFMLQRAFAELDQYEVVDEGRILRCGGDHEFLLSLINEFIEIYGDAPEQLRESLRKGETDAALRILHSIKGGGGNIGLVQVAKTAAFLEKSFNEPALLSAPDPVYLLEQAIKNLRDYLLKQ